jgi:hypothetical protein
MKVIGAGLGGTGTLQASSALETLGAGPCYSVMEIYKHPEQVAFWKAVADGEPVEWDSLLAPYESAVGYPACVCYADLLVAYPEAKVLLTVRDPVLAYHRELETIYRYSRGPDSALPPDLQHAFDVLMWEGTFGGAFEDQARTVAAYETWIPDVQARVPAEQLLVYDVAEGWDPLCAFLGVEVPDVPFPDSVSRTP